MEIKCVGPVAGTNFIQREPFGKYIEIQRCFNAELTGIITTGDTVKFEQFIKEQTDPIDGSLLHTIYLLSPGGNIYEAMQIGKIIRDKFLSVEATPYNKDLSISQANAPKCGREGKPVCCASACALIYFGGAQWSVGDVIGLHRPKLEDLGEYESFTEASKNTIKANQDVKDYLTEMEVDEDVYKTMMTTPPNKITPWNIGSNEEIKLGIFYKYPKTINDWLFARCRKSGDRPRDKCMSELAWEEAKNKSHAERSVSPLETKLKSMSETQLLDFIKNNPSDKNIANEQLSKLRLEQDKDKIDNMAICEVIAYLDSLFDEQKQLRIGENKTVDRALERQEALTGSNNAWTKNSKQRADCIKMNTKN